MISHLNQQTARKLSTWATHIIVGAGASGGVLAARLAEVPTNRILVLELGPDSVSPPSLAFDTTMQLGRKYRYPRGHGPGGSTNHHGLVDGRGNGLVYDHIAELVQDDRWSYQNVLPYYIKMETYTSPYADMEYHGSNGWLKVEPSHLESSFFRDVITAASEVTGAPIYEDPQGPPENADGIGPIDFQMHPDGSRSYVVDDLLLPQIKKSNNLVVLLNTLVTRVLLEPISDDEYDAVGVETIHGPHIYSVDPTLPETNSELVVDFFASKEVILSGGAINTPQILMLSGIGPREHLEQLGIPVLLDRPGVGSNLLDHQEVNVIYEVDANKSEYLASRSPIPEGVAIDWYPDIPSDIGHDVHITTSRGFFFDFDDDSLDPLPDGNTRIDYMQSQYDPYNPRVFQHYLIENLAISQANGTVRLQSSDSTQAPLLDLRLYEDDEAAERLARTILMVREIAHHPLLRQYYKLDENNDPIEIFPGQEYETVDELKDYVKRWSAFGHHISGTAKMGPVSQEDAVVDTRLRVHGVPNLRIVDTSIYPFPYLHGYNTSRGAYLIGEMAADFIKESEIKESEIKESEI